MSMKIVEEMEIGGLEKWFALREQAENVIKIYDKETGAQNWDINIDDIQNAINDLETAVQETNGLLIFYPFYLLAELARHARGVLETSARVDFSLLTESEDVRSFQTAVERLDKTMKNVEREMFNDGIFAADEFPAVIARKQIKLMEQAREREIEENQAMHEELMKLRGLLDEWLASIRGMVANEPEYLQFTDRVNNALQRPFMRLLTAGEWSSMPGADDPGFGWWNTPRDGINITKLWSVDYSTWERAKNSGMSAMRERFNGLYIISNG